MKRLHVLAVALGLLASGHVTAQNAPPTDGWETAQLEMEHMHWLQAYQGFVQLADQGDVMASRMAYQMWLYAPQLYGQMLPARVEQVQRWGALCECTPVKRAQTSPVGSTTAATQ
ncbi:MAG: hypothetical protein IPG98_08300 [Burkholderiales bacterium]|nr:hypothetical protein [Burkholderiales bacterium]MBK8666037.1 hypothetical protein [Burkholderiales bacterium]